jgi:hypothetical protein
MSKPNSKSRKQKQKQKQKQKPRVNLQAEVMMMQNALRELVGFSKLAVGKINAQAQALGNLIAVRDALLEKGIITDEDITNIINNNQEKQNDTIEENKETNIESQQDNTIKSTELSQD